MQRLQIQLFVGFGWNKACRRPLYRLSYGMGISEIILVPLPKRLCVRRRHLLQPRCNAPAWDLLLQHDAAARIKANHVKRVLAHIYSDGVTA